MKKTTEVRIVNAIISVLIAGIATTSVAQLSFSNPLLDFDFMTLNNHFIGGMVCTSA